MVVILDGASIIDKRLVTFPDDLYDTEVQIQPNGIDLRLHRVVHISGVPKLPELGRLDADMVQVNEIPLKNGWFDLTLQAGNYLVDFRETASIADGWCAIIKTRSSLVRCGVDVMSGLYDTGWEGRLGASIRLTNPISIQYGARLAQILFLKSNFAGARYSGRYKGTTQSEFK